MPKIPDALSGLPISLSCPFVLHAYWQVLAREHFEREPSTCSTSARQQRHRQHVSRSLTRPRLAELGCCFRGARSS